MWGNIAIAFLLAFIISFMTTPYSIKLAKKVGAVDVPNDERRMHGKIMPKLGGIAVIAGFLVSLIYLICIMVIEKSFDLFGVEQYYKKLIGLFLGVVIITVVGIADDIKTLKPYQKLIGQVIAASIVVAFGIQIEHINIPAISTIGLNQGLSIALTIIWIVGITNAINLMDGLDGLSSGITLISCISLLIIFALNYSPLIAILIVTCLIGALVGFLPFNFANSLHFSNIICPKFL